MFITTPTNHQKTSTKNAVAKGKNPPKLNPLQKHKRLFATNRVPPS
jgi:hypothetical protein